MKTVIKIAGILIICGVSYALIVAAFYLLVVNVIVQAIRLALGG